MEKLKVKLAKHNKTAKEKEGAAVFFAESQDSFVEYVKEKKNVNKVGIYEDLEVEETEGKYEREKKYRKSFEDLNNESKRLRTDYIMTAVENDAEKQKISPNKLLFYLLYRKNYATNRKLALEMLKLYKGEEQTNEVDMMETIALVSRGRFGRTMFNYTRRMLKPHQGKIGQDLFRFSNLFLKMQ